MDWLKQIAPTIATAMGGPLAGMAVSAISKAIGVDEGKVGDLIANNGCYVVPTEGPERGLLRQLASAPVGAEVCGCEFTPDGTITNGADRRHCNNKPEKTDNCSTAGHCAQHNRCAACHKQHVVQSTCLLVA